MIVERLEIDGLLLFVPKKYEDERGSFRESFHAEQFCDAVKKKIVFVQDNESQSKKNVIRGLHFQSPPYAQGKLVRVVHGSVLDVAVDIRRNSPTYLKWHAEMLSDQNGKIFWIPEGFAHGFVALEEKTKFLYKCTNYYHPEAERTLLWNDQTLNIQWNVTQPIVSLKDQSGIPIKELKSPFV